MYSPTIVRENNEFMHAFSRPLPFFGVQRLTEDSDNDSSLQGPLLESDDEELIILSNLALEIKKMVIAEDKEFTADSKLDFELISNSTCLTPRQRQSSCFDLEPAQEEPLAEKVSSNESGISDFWLEDIPKTVHKKLTFELKAEQQFNMPRFHLTEVIDP